MLRSILIACTLLTGSFLAGMWNAARQPPVESQVAPAMSGGASQARVATALPARGTRSKPPSEDHRQRFTPPPLPDDDPGVAELVHAGREPSAASVQEAYERDDRRLEELFGTSFPIAKRDAVRVAQLTWMSSHQQAVQDYYKGEISEADLALAVHQNMLAWAWQVQTALSPDEYRRFTDLEPGADPYVQLVPPGTQVGGKDSQELGGP